MITSSKTSSAPVASQSSAKRLEKPGRRRHAAHVPGDGLDDDRRETLAVALDGRGRTRRRRCTSHDDRVGGDAGRDAGRGRDAERGEPRAGAREELVGVAVVAAGELDHAVAPREPAREPDAPTSPPRCPTRPAARARPTAARRRSPPPARPRARSARRTSCRRAPASRTASTVSGSAWPKIERPPGLHPVEQRRPSAVSRYAPPPRATKNGSSRPTPRIARTGELTPPGISLPGAMPQLRARARARREVLRPVREDHVGAGALDRRQRLDRRRLLVEVAGGRGRLDHRILAAHVVRGERQVEAVAGRAEDVEVRKRRLDHQDVGALGNVELAFAQRFAHVARIHLVAAAVSERGAHRRRRGTARRTPTHTWRE